ncbi:uncharacterized protein Z518_03940 [Rhinocladiella mackenziei CBS 650.93]|uniref:HIT-type domain-containing protein n=1 Tax=Rhinocladiella mackenziei CBS 650.93 TaxID=1442369 RepID=A0A0D2IS68_9EURO|nr:uncharacterized protein Z518_03940 [Rhinocladiella mackenziei CBS 650.93]KIX05966.1 hypothetical protein Z518_03940 [Rhinocladiella mackenziei CBS 650.93]
MPLIEELPVTAANARPSHGWTYVADTGAPFQTAHFGSRKRGRDGTTVVAQAAHKLSAKQEKAIQQRLNDLGKENYREVNIPVPKRDGTRDRDRKSTQNVRRILAYSRTFQHYLADEEAGVNVYGSAGIAPTTNAGTQAGHGQGQAQKAADTRRRGMTAHDAITSIPRLKGAGAQPRRTASLKQPTATSSKSTCTSTPEPSKNEQAPTTTSSNGDVEMADAPISTAHQQQYHHQQTGSPSTSQKSPRLQKQQRPTPSQSQSLQSPSTPSVPSYDPALDRDPLLITHDVPKMPSERVMQALLAEPPLSYNAARAKPLEDSTSSSAPIYVGNNAGTAKPQRWFCCICGYWGKVRCKNGCGERVCGLLECWKSHEGVCSLGAY